VVQQRNGSDRRQRPTEDAGQLVAHRRTGVADVGGKHLGDERRLRAVKGGVQDQRHHRGECDQREVPGVEQGEEHEHPHRRTDGADEHDGPSADPVGEMPEVGDRDDLHGRGDQRRVEGVFLGQVQICGDVRRDEQHEGVERHVHSDAGADGQQHLAGVSAQHRHDRRMRLLAGLLDLGEQRALGDGHPDPQPDDHQHTAEQERHPPPPRQERIVGGNRIRQRQYAVGQQQSDRDAHLRPAGVEAASAGVPRFQRHQDGPAPLTAQAQALQEAQHHQQHRRPDADRGIRRQQPDEHRRDAHQQQGGDQDVLPTDPIAVVAEYHTAQRPGDESDGVGGERQ